MKTVNTISAAEEKSVLVEVKEKLAVLSTSQRKSFVQESYGHYKRHQRNATKEFLFYVVSLNEIISNLKKGEKDAWYSEFDLSPRSAQKKILVAKKLGGYKTVQLDVFSPSQLIRLAEIKNRNVIDVIVNKGLLVSSSILDQLNPITSEIFHASDTPDDIEMKLIAYMEKLESYDETGALSGRKREQGKSDAALSGVRLEVLSEHSKQIEAGLCDLLQSLDLGELRSEKVESDLASLESSIFEIKILIKKIKEALASVTASVGMV